MKHPSSVEGFCQVQNYKYHLNGYRLFPMTAKNGLSNATSWWCSVLWVWQQITLCQLLLDLTLFGCRVCKWMHFQFCEGAECNVQECISCGLYDKKRGIVMCITANDWSSDSYSLWPTLTNIFLRPKDVLQLVIHLLKSGLNKICQHYTNEELFTLQTTYQIHFW